MPDKKSDYEKELDEFYQLADEVLDEYEEAFATLRESEKNDRVLNRDESILIQHSDKDEQIKELFTLFYESLTKEEKEKLKEKHGSEWTHIENHFRNIKKDGE